MGKERKGRLDKNSASEFIGFGAFAVSNNSNHQQEQSSDSSPSSNSKLQWSPVYIGSDQQLSLLFKKIGQKRDSVTKAKALSDELLSYFSSTTTSKKDQISALSHFAFIYHAKLSYDPSSAVRATSLNCLEAAQSRVPKAFATLFEQEPELYGMVWCARVDPAAEVRVAALTLKENGNIKIVSAGICSYVKRILGYKRSREMHTALFARTGNAGATGKDELSPSEREQADEKFERIAGTALGGIEEWVKSYPEQTSSWKIEEHITDGILWKNLSSSKGSFRRKTYSLVGTLCQHAPSLVYGKLGFETIPKQLVVTLASEKEGVNIPILLEVLLLYLVSFPAKEGKSWFDSGIVNVKVLCKNLNKLFRSACYGAKGWESTMLPLLATLPLRSPEDEEAFSLQLQMLSSLWEGKEAAISTSDTLCIVAAVEECASFLLLRRLDSKDQAQGSDLSENSASRDIAIYLSKTVHFFLSMPNVSLAAQEADKKLAEVLTRDLYKLSSTSREDCALFGIKDFAWNGIRSSILEAGGETTHSRLAQLINRLNVLQEGKKDNNGAVAEKLQPIFRDKYRSIWSCYRTSSRNVPDASTYDVMISCLEYCGGSYIFDLDQLTEDFEGKKLKVNDFLMNELLRWIVVHSTSLETDNQYKTHRILIQKDFNLLRIILFSSPELNPKAVWESILQEMIAAKCDLEMLSMGIAVLLGYSEEFLHFANIISCDTFDRLAVQIGKDTVEEYVECKAGGMNKRKLFLQTCAGVNNNRHMILVSKHVIKEWVEVSCSGQIDDVVNDKLPNPLFSILLSLLDHNDCFDARDVERLILESWRVGGNSWYGAALNMMIGNSTERKSDFDLCQRIISQASEDIELSLRTVCTSDAAEIGKNTCIIWSERAFRLLELTRQLKKTESSSSERSPSLSLVGLADIDLWEKSITEDGNLISHRLYVCLVNLLRLVADSTDRLALLLNSGEANTSKLVVPIMLSLVDLNGVSAGIPKQKKRCDDFLSLLGGREELSHTLINDWLQEAVDRLALSMKTLKKENESCVYRGISVLSSLVGLAFDDATTKERKQATPPDTVFPTDIREGEMYWYLSDKNDESKRDKAEVVKIHDDDFPSLYYTIRLQNDGEKGIPSERQTVAERLRRTPGLDHSRVELSSQTGTKQNKAGDEELMSRQLVEEVIMKQLVRPFLITQKSENPTVIEAIGECLNVVISQCGLFGKAKGLGSLKYDVFKIISSLEKEIGDIFSFSDMSEMLVAKLSCLSSAMGFGRFTTVSSNFKSLGFAANESIKTIVRSCDSMPEHIKPSLTTATLAWLTIAIPSLSSGTLRNETRNTAYKLASQFLGGIDDSNTDLGDDNFLVNALLVIRSLEDIQDFEQDSRDSGNDEEKKIIFNRIIRAFLKAGKSNINIEDQTLKCAEADSHHGPSWHSPFSSFLLFHMKHSRSTVSTAAKELSNMIIDCLFDASKRFEAFLLIHAVANSGIEACPKLLNDGTKSRLNGWKGSLQVEEAEELEDDINVVNRWLPDKLMNEFESWYDETPILAGHDNDDEATAIGRMLCWVSFLEFIDVAASVDVVNRGAFSSYIKNCGVINSIISSAISYAHFDDERKNNGNSIIDIDTILKDKESMEVSPLATFVLFRTVEVLPTLFKQWWVDECPKSISNVVSKFVESKVAPETLRRELNRIQNASDIGDLFVAGSCVSREVTATYEQDECQLSLVISVPANFPLRNVDVDGRQTLGVPEKRWKRWALQIRLMLNNQDGTLLDALMLWKENVDKEFEGIEPCPVCYSVLSVKGHELPKLQCNQCKNCFHTACLYQWFRTSGKSQCVLCQQAWSGTRIQ